MKNIRLSSKFLIYLICIGALTSIAIGYISFQKSKSALLTRTYHQLSSIRELKKNQVQHFFTERHSDIEVLESNPFTKAAFKDIKQAFYRAQNNGSSLLQITETTVYKNVLSKYNHAFSTYMTKYGYYDIFLIDPLKGDILYTVALENDFGTRLSAEKTHLATLWQKCVNSNTTVISDMKKYAPSNDAPAMFIATPIIENNATIGVLAYQISNDAINQIMQEKTGLGESGETYLVGADLLLRSDSRFSNEPTVLQLKVETQATQDALSGIKKEQIIKDYRGINVLSCYDKVEIGDKRWAIISEIDEAEILVPVRQLALTIFIASLIIIAVIAMAALAIAKSLSNPIEKSLKVA